MRRSGRMARASSTSDVTVWAERGSRLPWARATRAGAVMGVASFRGVPGGAGARTTLSGTVLRSVLTGFSEADGKLGARSLVDAALGLPGPGPAAAARVLAGSDASRARPAAD